MAESLTMRAMNDEDLPGVLDTLRAALGETAVLKRTPEQWHWKHTLNPFGRSIVLVAADRDRIAGIRAFMRWQLATTTGSTLSCVRAVDTAVHPEYRRRGLFSALNEAALELATADGVDMVFNTPNEQSRPGYLKQGWQDVGPVGVMVRPSYRMAIRQGDAEFPDAEDILPGASFAGGIKGTDRKPLGLRTVRSEAYWRWRFEQHPTASYLQVGAKGSTAVLRINRRSGRDELVVSELIGTNGSAAIRRAASMSQAAYLVGWFSPGSPERTWAKLAGMIPVPRVTALNLVARPLSQFAAQVGVFAIGNWDLAMSDLELL
jgi:GNAT superfamily N-acetyltransferase